MAYEFVTSVVRYRDTETGRFVPRRTVLRYADMAVTAGQDAADVLANLVSTGQISPADWFELMQQEIKSTFIQEAILGKGGRSSMTPSDWGSVGRQLRDQYAYLEGFREDIENGVLSEAQIRSRSHLYFLASKGAFERGQGAAWGIVLPGYPGDKELVCNVGCKCYWFIRRADERTVLATWTRTAAESCPSCLKRASDWAELVYVDGVLKNAAATAKQTPLMRRPPLRSGLLAASTP